MDTSLARLVLTVTASLVWLLSTTPTVAQPPLGRGGGTLGQGGRGTGPFGPGGPRDARLVQADIPTGTAAVSGTVVVAGTGQPARRARVSLNAIDGGGSRAVLTDESGAYAFSGVAAGRYNLSASKAGHVGVTYGQTQPGRPGTPIQLAEGEKFTASLQLPRGGVITGTVLDEYGEPTPGTQVRVMRYVMQAGRRTVRQSGNGSTDDRGIYRVYGLQPGEYIVSAVARNTGSNIDVSRLTSDLQAVRAPVMDGAVDAAVTQELLAARASALEAAMRGQEEQATGYAPVYYPGTTAATEALAVPLGLGEERAGVDFQLQRVPMARIEGTVVNSTGLTAQNVQVTLTNPSQPFPGIGVITARADAEGRFRLMNVPPGVYRLIARANAGVAERGEPLQPMRRGGGQSPIRLWGSMDVPVDGRHLSNLIVTLQQGLTVSGRVTFDGALQQPPSDLSRVRVTLAPADPQQAGGLGQAASGRVDESGRFSIPGVVPGHYRLTASGAGRGWVLESSVLGGQDSLDFPVEIRPGSALTDGTITFTDRQTELSGSLIDQRGQPAPHFTLVLFSADERYWGPQSRRILSTRPSTDGRFIFAGFPPGEYRLVALADAEPGAWFEPAFLQELEAAAMSVRVADGEKKIQNIQIAQ